jgi:hypothetical protein
MRLTLAILLGVLFVASQAVQAEEPPDSWLAQAKKNAAKEEAKAEAATTEAATQPQGKGPPLPFHTLEGVGGALAVPMAYVVNPGPPGTIVGTPAVSTTFIGMGTKNIWAVAVTETLFRRIELGYAMDRFDTGDLPLVVKKVTGGVLNDTHHNVILHNFNARAIVVEENTPFLGIPMPAVAAGVQVKYNGTIQDLNEEVAGGLGNAGLDKANGVDYVLTASKMFPKLMFGRPLILTAGMRNSSASNFGFTGFADHCATTFEGDAVALVTDWLAVGYEFRQRSNPYDVIPEVLGDEGNFHAIRVGFILSPRLSVAAAWAFLGPVGNAMVDCAWGIQLKYEF